MHFKSKFGGLWTDSEEASEIASKKLSGGLVSESEYEQLLHWIEEGYVIIPQAVPLDIIDEVNADIAAVWAKNRKDVIAQTSHAGWVSISKLNGKSRGSCLTDFFVKSRASRKLTFAPKILRFLNLLFEEDALAFQSLTFETGSNQAIHNDTAYVVIDPPNHLAASWVALENTLEGSGELTFYPKSHKFPEKPFGNRKHWIAEIDGEEAHLAFTAHIHRSAKERGITQKIFKARKGDALLWAANFGHGGLDILDPQLTRRSFVSHYCPISATPNYFVYKPTHKTCIPVTRGGLISSSHYRLTKSFWRWSRQALGHPGIFLGSHQ